MGQSRRNLRPELRGNEVIVQGGLYLGKQATSHAFVYGHDNGIDRHPHRRKRIRRLTAISRVLVILTLKHWRALDSVLPFCFQETARFQSASNVGHHQDLKAQS